MFRIPCSSTSSTATRATSPVVGVVLLVGVTVVLAGVSGAVVAFGASTVDPAPRVHLDATLDATDGWPEGQQLRLVHEAGDPLRVEELVLVVEIPRVGTHSRLSGFPTRRLTDDGVRGDDVFDGGYAGVDGALDAAHTDGLWQSGEAASVRIAQHSVDVRPGDTAHAEIVHEPTGAVLTRLDVTAT